MHLMLAVGCCSHSRIVKVMFRIGQFLTTLAVTYRSTYAESRNNIHSVMCLPDY